MQIRFRVTVDGGKKHHAARFGQPGAGTDDGGRVGHMLHHFHAGNDVVSLRGFGRQIFHADTAVGNIVQLPHLCMVFGGLQRFFRQIDTQNLRRASIGHTFAQDAAAAADIQHFLARQTGKAVDIVQTDGVDVVQRLEFALFIPPFVGKAAEFVDFFVVHIRLLLGLIHWILRFSGRRHCTRNTACRICLSDGLMPTAENQKAV